MSIADDLTKIVLDQLHKNKKQIKEGIPMPQRLAFPVAFPLLLSLIPGIVETILEKIGLKNINLKNVNIK